MTALLGVSHLLLSQRPLCTQDASVFLKVFMLTGNSIMMGIKTHRELETQVMVSFSQPVSQLFVVVA